MTRRRARILSGLLVAAGTLGLVAAACMAPGNRSGDRTVEIPWTPPTASAPASAPAGIDVDMDELAGIVAAKLKVELAATINASVQAQIQAQGVGDITSYFGPGAVAVQSLLIIFFGVGFWKAISRAECRAPREAHCSQSSGTHPTH